MRSVGGMFMKIISATNARQHFSEFIDEIVRERPVIIKRNRDLIMSFALQDISSLLEHYRFTVNEFIEDDNSITLSLNEFDLVVNEPDRDHALDSMTKEIKEYAEEYYQNFRLYLNSPNRRTELPYVLKVLSSKSIDEVKGSIKYHA